MESLGPGELKHGTTQVLQLSVGQLALADRELKAVTALSQLEPF